MPIDITPLMHALTQLELGLHEAEKNPTSELLRDGVIQRFEYSHEMSLKMIRRVLETIFGDPVDQMAYNDILRTAAERSLIVNVETWFGYRTARNKTSHTYDAKVAKEVFGVARGFLDDGKVLLTRLHAAIDQPPA